MTKKVDKDYCMSSFLTFRFVQDEDILFFDGVTHSTYKPTPKEDLHKCFTYKDMDFAFSRMGASFDDGRTALMLSGGIDSAVLASYMPKGSVSYTLKCVADGAVDETPQARKYAEYYGLEHRIIDIHWEDHLRYAPLLMKAKGAPIHSIEVQLYKAALQAKKDGFDRLILGECADIAFGGLDRLLSKDWTLAEFMDFNPYVKPEKVLKKPVSMRHIYEQYSPDGRSFDAPGFIAGCFGLESAGAYVNTFELADMAYYFPFGELTPGEPLDLDRIRNGESKYLIRELFASKYPGFEIREKIPLPRAVTQWLADWKGPERPEFIPGSTEGFTGDQKWLVYCLEKFLDLHDEGKI